MEALRSTTQTTLDELIHAADAGALALPVGLDASHACSCFARAGRRLEAAGVSHAAGAAAFWVPGRVEVAGKHTDYAGGRSLLCAATRGFFVVSTERPDAVFRVHVAFGASASVRLEPEPAGCAADLVPGAAEEEKPEWLKYPSSVARRLRRNWGALLGTDLAFECDLPEASGLSSSSAFVTLAFLSLASRNRLAQRPDFTGEGGSGHHPLFNVNAPFRSPLYWPLAGTDQADLAILVMSKQFTSVFIYIHIYIYTSLYYILSASRRYCYFLRIT